jgi:carbon monoxide dehydrogenase subunit G
MATIYHEFLIDAPAQFVWEAIKDVGAVHSRLAQGFVTATELRDGERTVTFANGFVAREKIIGVNDDVCRLSYCALGGRAAHHNAYFQVFSASEEQSRVLWVTDLLPDEVRPAIEQMVRQGAEAMKQTLERSYFATKSR